MGWSDGVWTITGFANYLGHTSPNNVLAVPTCFWAAGFAAGDCYAGSPYFPQPSAAFGNLTPATVLMDMAIRYQTGLDSPNEYLQNLSFDLTISNVLNKSPPVIMRGRGRRGLEPAAFLPIFDERQRTVSFTITKIWVAKPAKVKSKGPRSCKNRGPFLARVERLTGAL